MTFVTRELSPETWQDFEALFSRDNGWDHCWCTAFQKAGPRGPVRLNRIERGRVNKDLKRRLVMSGQAHGILVYDSREPIGWCQLGPATELRAPHGGRPRDEADGAEALWRITCFVTDKRYRRLGVAGLALEEALAVIRDSGGRVVEAYPVVHWQTDPELARLVRRFGADSTEVTQHRATHRRAEVAMEGIGTVVAAHGSFGNVSTQGTVSMFERAGFEPVRPVGRGHLLMRLNL